MTRIDHADDEDDGRQEILDRLRALETANPLAHASLSSGLLRILVGGQSVAAIGHASNRAGFLIASGGGYVRVQEWVAQQIAANQEGVQDDLDWLGQQLGSLSTSVSSLSGTVGSLGARMGTAEAGLDWVGARSTIHDSQIGGLSGRMAAAEGSLSSHSSSIAGLVARDATLTNLLNGVIDYVVALEAFVRQQHPTKNPPPPPTKG